MLFKSLKYNDKYFWTEHSKFKMRQYGLSPQRVIRVIRNPQRIEEGIVENTIAVMQPASVRLRRTSAGKPASVRPERTLVGKPATKSWSQEIWVMYQLRKSRAISKSHPPAGGPISNKTLNPKLKNYKLKTTNHKLKIISAWRYPGISPKNNPIPEEILREIKGVI